MGTISPGTDPSNAALFPNPNGAPPNLVNAPSLETAVLGVGISLIAVSGCCLTIRLFANLNHTGKLGLDDVLCVLAEFGGIAYWAGLYTRKSFRRFCYAFAYTRVVARDGAATHSWDAPASVITSSFLKRWFALEIIFNLTTWAAKSSILALYIRIFHTVRWMRISAYSLIIFTGMFYFANIVLAIVYCAPRNGAPWGVDTFAKCTASETIVIAVVSGSYGVAVDLAVFALPFPLILSLQLTGRKRVGVIAVFLVGVLIVIISVVSLAYRILAFLGNDPLWNGFNVIIATISEILGTVIVSCAPALASFWKNFFKKTKLYSTLRSRFHFHRTQSTNSETGDVAHGYGLRSSWKRQDHFVPLEDGASAQSRKDHSEAYDFERSSVPMETFITQPAYIKQSVDSIPMGRTTPSPEGSENFGDWRLQYGDA